MCGGGRWWPPTPNYMADHWDSSQLGLKIGVWSGHEGVGLHLSTHQRRLALHPASTDRKTSAAPEGFAPTAFLVLLLLLLLLRPPTRARVCGGGGGGGSQLFQQKMFSQTHCPNTKQCDAGRRVTPAPGDPLCPPHCPSPAATDSPFARASGTVIGPCPASAPRPLRCCRGPCRGPALCCARARAWRVQRPGPRVGRAGKPRKYPVFRIPPDASIFPIFPSGYLDTRFFIHGPVGKQVAFRKNGKNGTCPCPIFHPFAPPFLHHFPPFFFLVGTVSYIFHEVFVTTSQIPPFPLISPHFPSFSPFSPFFRGLLDGILRIWNLPGPAQVTFDMRSMSALWTEFASRCLEVNALVRYLLTLVDKGTINYADVEDIFLQTTVQGPDKRDHTRIPMYAPPRDRRWHLWRLERRLPPVRSYAFLIQSLHGYYGALVFQVWPVPHAPTPSGFPCPPSPSSPPPFIFLPPHCRAPLLCWSP